MAKYDTQRDHLERMVERDKGLQKSRESYQRMSRLEFTLPEPLASMEWAYPIRSASPYIALNAGTRALSNKQEILRIHPVTVLKALGNVDVDSEKARALANEWKTNLLWQMGRMEMRTPSLRSSIRWSSLLYHEIVGQLIHLPTQFKAAPVSKREERAALRIGDWALRIVAPQETYIDYTDLMAERCAFVTVKTAQQLIDFWGERAARIQKLIDSEKIDADTEFCEVDFIGLDDRVVWCAEGNRVEDAIESKKGIVLFGPEPWLKIAVGENKGEPVPFLPLIAVCGGLQIDAAPEHQRKPMLYPVWAAEQYVSTNIMGTILASLAVSEAAAPVDVFSGVGSENVEIDYTRPGGRVNLPNQFLTYQRIQRLGLDKAMSELFGMFEAALRRSTVAEVLVTGQPMAGDQAFAAYNLQVMQALASIGDFKMLTERGLEETYQKMLLIAYYTGSDITGYGKDKKKYSIDSEDIDPDAIYLSVELKPDVPVDAMQRATSAVAMANSLPYAPQRILEQLDEPDPEGALKLWKNWRIDLADFEGKLEMIKLQQSGQLDQMIQQRAMEIVQQAAAQQKEAAPEGMSPGLGLNQGQPANPVGGTMLQGPMMNPAQGGAAPAQATPMGNTREGQRGVSRGGTAVQGGY
jgi:hypothetical protein